MVNVVGAGTKRAGGGQETGKSETEEEIECLNGQGKRSHFSMV